MAVGPGTRVGPYEVTALLGEGGMGKVWRAYHTALKRDDALKVLPDAFATDPERLARFEREAQVLASLNHPNIARVYGLEAIDGGKALVMELVEGLTLADRVAHGPIPPGEALAIAKQIAEALEAAHEQGIIHRDLKPANVKVRPDGSVTVLDFGLAKVLDSTESRAMISQAATVASPAVTHAGVILGTAAYMSPEQARGREADRRSDVWAFGALLFEMLTGKRCFGGDDVADTLAFVLTKEPDWASLPPGTPPPIGNLVHRCLEKDRQKRIAHISTARFAIDEASTLGTIARATSPAVAASQVPLWRRLGVHGATALLAAAAAAGGMWLAMRPVPPRVSRLAIATTPATALTINGVDRDIAITPDGLQVVYVGNNGRELFVRSIDALESRSLFTGAPRGPFVSPDGQWVGFIDGLNVMKKVAITGGPPIPIAIVDGVSRGATWMPDDTIVFASNSTSTGLQQVAAGGGPTTVLTRPNRAAGDLDHLWPERLPGGSSLLFTSLPVGGGVESALVAVFDRQTGSQKVVVRGGSHAHYVSSGHLVYAAANMLRAIAFDPAGLETRGTAVPVASEVVTTGLNGGGADADVASDGTLAYVRGLGGVSGARTLAWVDRQGRETPIDAPPRMYVYPRISPEGGRVMAWINDQQSDLWLWDFARRTLGRLTFAPGVDLYPEWSPDGGRVFFASDRDGSFNLFWQAANGTGAAVRLTQSPNVQFSSGVTPDGTRLIFTESTTTGDDVMQVETIGKNTITPLVSSPSAERNGTVSPDGRWLAYEADDSGSLEIYVRPYPDVKSGYAQVSTGGGTRPLWSRTGQELFYVSPAGAILRVGVQRGDSWVATTPTTIAEEGSVMAPPGFLGRTYDVSPDGQRFLVLKSAGGTTAAPPELVIVQHFDQELKRLVATQ